MTAPKRYRGRGRPRPAPAQDGALAKAATLIEALPWLERFHGQIVVIKYGGNAMTDDALRRAFAQDVVFLRYAGLRAGRRARRRAADQRAARPARHRSRRSAAGCGSPRPEAMDVVRMVLTGQVNREVVGLINRARPVRGRACPARTRTC